MPKITLREKESFESAMRRFKRTIEKSGLLEDLRGKEHFEKPTTARKRKKEAAVKRANKEKRVQQLPAKLY